MEYDWDLIRAEYVSGTISYRNLAKKHGVPVTTLEHRAKVERWVEQRRQLRGKAAAKTIENLAKQQAARATRLQDMADELLTKAETAMKRALTPKDLRSLSRTLLDIKELQDIKPDLDRQEQEARIANLRKQTEKDDDNADEVVLRLEGGIEDYAK